MNVQVYIITCYDTLLSQVTFDYGEWSSLIDDYINEKKQRIKQIYIINIAFIIYINNNIMLFMLKIILLFIVYINKKKIIIII